MKATAILALLLCASIFAASCGVSPDEPPVTGASTCVLDTESINQPARVMGASAFDPACEPAAASIRDAREVVVERGRLFGLPLKLTSVTSYDGASFAASCVYDVRGYVDVAPPGAACAVTVDVWARVVVK